MGTLTLILVATLLCGQLAKRLNLPAVVLQILAGVCLGPAVLGWVANTAFMQHLADIGVVLLMFMAGLSTRMAHLKVSAKTSLIVAIMGVVLPIGIFGLIGPLFRLSLLESYFIGVIFAATSISISLVVLQEFHALDRPAGSIILGAAVIDDVLAIMALSIVASFMPVKQQPLQLKLAGILVFVVLAYLGYQYIIPWVLQFSRKSLVPHAVPISALMLAFTFAWLAETLGLSAVLGAFIAGLAMATTDSQNEVRQGLGPISDHLFVPIFFVSIGVATSFAGLATDWRFLVTLLVLAVLTKWVGCGLGAKLMGVNHHDADLIGVAMISRGEMALIVAKIGLNTQLVSSNRYAAIILVIMLTTLISPLWLKRLLVSEGGN